MDKLGFTFYVKDWWTSDTYFDLDFFERYIFLECMFSMYNNGGSMKPDKKNFERRHSVKITDEQWENVTKHFVIEDGNFTLTSVNKRLKKAITNRLNGQAGGRPPKPKKPSLETQKNPPLEREREIESEREEEKEIIIEKPSFDFFTLTNFHSVEIGENEFTLLACRRSGKNTEEVKVLFAEFLREQQAVNRLTWKSEAEAKTHFHNWIAKKKNSSSGKFMF